MASTERPEFTVDTGLFRQLGELLVGRDSTALVELVKNSYDADATSVVIRGERLSSPSESLITISDDGLGMTDSQFRRGFLRLAARGKVEAGRFSPLYQRRYTGEKGVGRLAAHKLAALLDVTTIAAINRDGLPFASSLREAHPELTSEQMLDRLRRAARTLMMAQIDWDAIESVDTIADIREGLILEAGEAGDRAPTGTTLNLTRLRHEWTEYDLRDVVRQLNNFKPPASLVEALPRNVLNRSLLFTRPLVRDAERNDPGISVEFEGEFSDPEEFWGDVVRTADWVLEIRSKKGSDIQFQIAPTRVGLATNPFASPISASLPHPMPDSGPFFDARILLRPGATPTTEGSWAEFNSGIRVYLEGFRILPYGEPRNDWLSLDFDYTKRSGRYDLDPLLGGPEDDLSSLRELATRDVNLRLLPNRAFFGAVFLTEAGSGGLRTLVNREGFVPDEAHTRLVQMVTAGIRILLRSHALASYRLKQYQQETKKPQNAGTEPGANPNSNGLPAPPTGTSNSEKGDGDEETGDGGQSESQGEEWRSLGDGQSPRGSAARLLASINAFTDALNPLIDGGVEITEADIGHLRPALAELQQSSDQIIRDVSLLRVLASVGSQLAAFTHELSFLVPAAVAAEKSLDPVEGTKWPQAAIGARRTIADLRRSLERQASFLVDVASSEGRRRRSRQNLRKQVAAAFLGLQGASAARDVQLVNDVSDELRTPPLFRAELQAILSNLLSNAIKAAGSPGRVRVGGEQLPSGIRIVIENSGVKVSVGESEKWFTPYESTTTGVDLVLGQGMGLGLPITRDLVSEYGGTVRFIQPSDDFATAVEVVLPE